MCLGGRLICPQCPPNHYFINPERAQQYPLPLLGVFAKIQVFDFVAEFTLLQRYENREKQPLEVIYEFPLPENAVVTQFEATIDNKVVVGQVKEKEEAQNEYDDAIASGHGAYLLEQKSTTMFEASIGNFPPGKEIIIKLVYNIELEYDEYGKMLLILPANPFAPDGNLVKQFPAPTNPNSDYTSQVPHGLTIDIQLNMSNTLRSINCTTHKVDANIGRSGRDAFIQYPTQNAPLVKSMVIEIETLQSNKPYVRVQQDSHGRKAVMLAFYPVIESENTPTEIIFLVDRSGSMQGFKMERTKDTLQLFLRSLPPDTLFNIVSFGSNYSMLFQQSMIYDENSLAVATKHVDQMTANMGGTEILNPLKAILEKPVIDGVPRQLFILTDGAVARPEECIEYVRRHAQSTRVFCFGIGNGASFELVAGMAKAGNGRYEMIRDDESIEDKVLRQTNIALRPAITNLTINWGDQFSSYAPARTGLLFSGQRLLAYGFLKDNSSQQPISVTLSGTSKSLAQEIFETITFNPSDTIAAGNLIPALAARALITDLEHGQSYLHVDFGKLSPGVTQDKIKQEIIDLSIKYQVLSQYTAFIAVETRRDATSDAMVKRVIRTANVLVKGGMGGGRRMARGGMLRSGGVMKQTALATGFNVIHSIRAAAPKPRVEKRKGKMDSTGYSGVPIPMAAASIVAAAPMPAASIVAAAPMPAGQMSTPAPPPQMDMFAAPRMSMPAQSASAGNAGPPAAMKQLIMKQSAVGFWTVDAVSELFAKEKLVAGLSSLGVAESDEVLKLWATAIAVAILQVRYAKEQTSWSLVVKKALVYIAKISKEKNLGNIDWVEEAKKFINK